MTLEKRFDGALISQEPMKALRALVLDLSVEGFDKATILEIFEEHRQRLRAAAREFDEEVVMEVMDFLVGWCSPHMKLLPDDPETLNRFARSEAPPVQA